MSYEPRHLQAQQVTALYAQAIAQAEAAVAQAWINAELSRTNYEQTVAQLALLEADRDRALKAVAE